MQAMEERSTCVLRRTSDVEHLFTLKQMPVSMYCVAPDSPPEDDIHADMEWGISRGAGCVQLQKLVPLDLLYKHAHGSGTVGGIWLKHHSQFCDFVASQGVRRPLEIGAGHGVLARQYLERHNDASWVIVEPNLPNWRHDRVTMLQGLFDASFKLPVEMAPVDAVIHSHTFEHIYDPRQFLESVAGFLEVGQKHIFSLPRLDTWLERQYNNALHFEHTVLLTEGIVDELLRVSGFAVVEKQYFGEDHSVFYATEKVATAAATSADEDYRVQEYDSNRQLFLSYIQAQQETVMRINSELRAAAEGDVFLFGAHVFSQFLIAFGLDLSRVVGILDNDSAKQGKRLYGTSLRVCSAEALKTAHQPLVVLRAGSYRNEIVQGMEQVRADVRVIE